MSSQNFLNQIVKISKQKDKKNSDQIYEVSIYTFFSVLISISSFSILSSYYKIELYREFRSVSPFFKKNKINNQNFYKITKYKNNKDKHN